MSLVVADQAAVQQDLEPGVAVAAPHDVDVNVH
ncbi:hypothetical protein ABH935_009863 [Catenulispora sp. GAS73]